MIVINRVCVECGEVFDRREYKAKDIRRDLEHVLLSLCDRHKNNPRCQLKLANINAQRGPKEAQ